MILNNGDNQNKKSLGIKDVFYYESYLSCIASLRFLFIVTIVVSHMQNLDVCVWLHGQFS